MKRILALLLALIMVFALFGCKPKEETPETPSSPTGSATTPSDTTPDEPSEREPYELVYICISLAVEWCVDIAETLEMFEEEYNFNLTVADASNNSDTYANLVETYCEQGYDGLVLMCAEDIGPRIKEICDEYGTPILFDSIAIVDHEGKFLVPGVELNATAVGQASSQWLGDNYKEYLGDIDMSKTGYIEVMASSSQNIIARGEGATGRFKELFPDIPEGNYFQADLVAQGTVNAEAAFNEVGPILAANQGKIDNWLITAAQDMYGQGAARAVESAGLDNVSLVISMGGENMIPELEGGNYSNCWVAAIYFDAYDYSALLAPALVDILDGKTTIEELWPDWKAEGQQYASYQISGTPITKDTYKDIVAFY